MSGTRLTRKVTVEGGKKLPEGGGSNSSSSAGIRRLSVFERLGPGTSDRSKPRESRESYPPDKCRNWLRDGRCPFGRNCKFLHGPFSEPKQRKKGVRSVVRSEIERSEERDEGRLGGRTRSLDSLDIEGDEERPLPLKKKKHKTLEESSDPAKRNEKVKRKPIVEKESSDNEEEAAEDERKRKKKAKKRQLSGGVVVAKPRSPEQDAKDWGYDEFEEERSDLDWEEQGELDYERQLMLEKRRQDLRRQLALMDEEEAAIEKAERKVRDVIKDREDEPRAVPVVHSRLHPDKASVSPGDEPSPVSSQSTPKKKKKKSNGETKKLKLKRKSSPSSKESKKRKKVYLPPEQLGGDTEAVTENLRRVSDLTSEKLKVKGPQVQLNLQTEALEKPRVVKKKEMKTKAKESRAAKASENTFSSPPSEERVRVIPRSPPEEDILREKWSYSPDTERLPAEKVRRRAVLSSPEGHDSPTVQLVSEDRARRVTTAFEDSSQKVSRDVRDVGATANVQPSNRGKIHDKRYGIEGSPGTPEYGQRRPPVKDPRYVEEGKVEKRRKPPRSPSPEDISPRDAATPPEERRRQRTPPQGDRRGPQTPPGEPDFDEEPVEHTADSRRDVRRRKGPYTPPPPPGEQIRPKVDSSRDFREGRSEPVRYREPPDGPRVKERDERETRYQKPRSEDKIDDFPRAEREHSQLEDDYARNRTRDDEFVKTRHRDDRDEEYQRVRPKDDRVDDSYRTRDREPERGNDHHRSRPEEFRGDEHSRRKTDGSDEFFRRRDERDDDHLRGRNREPEKGDERQRRREDRPDEYQRTRGREEHEDDSQRSRVRDYPRRQMEAGDDRYWDRRGERESREPPYGERDRRRQDLPRQDLPDSRGRERPGDRPRERELRHPPPGPDYHRRPSPIPQGPRRSPPHGPPRGRSPHRYDERRRSLSPGGRREDVYRQGPPRDQGGFGMGRDPMRGRGAYSTPFDNRGRPLENRRRMSPPPRQYADRGRAGLRGRGGGGGGGGSGRGGRGFPDRMRPPGDRYREQPRDNGGAWDRDRRVPERDYPRDRPRPHEESRDRDRRPRGDMSPGRGPRHWEDRKGGSPGRAASPTRDRRAQDTERVPRDGDKEEEEEEWEYEEDMGEEKVPRHGERKRPRENVPSISRSASPAGGKKRRSESPEIKDVPTNVVSERSEEVNDEAESNNTVILAKPTTKGKKRKEGKKEGTSTKPEGETVPQETPVDLGIQPEGEKRVKGEKKHKKDKGKIKEKGAKKKKKSSASLNDAPETAAEVVEAASKKLEDGVAPASEITGEVNQKTDTEQTPKAAKKRKHAAAGDDEGGKIKLGDKPSKKKKKKKHQPEVVVQPWADLEGDDEETTATEHETSEARANDKEDTEAAQTRESLQEEKLSEAVEEESGKNPETPETKEPPAAKRMEEVFSDWSDDSPIGDDTWSDINEPTISEEQPKIDEKERKCTPSPGTNVAPSFDDVYDPISDDELDAMLGDEDDSSGSRPGDANAGNSATTPLPVEDVDWSALVSAQSTMEKKEEPGSHLKKFTPGHVFSHIGISSLLAGPRLTKLVQETLVQKEPPRANSIGALMAGAAAKRRERETLFTNVGPCRRALCARRDLAMRKRLRRLTGKVGLFQTPSSAPVDNELYQMSVALYKHDPSATDSSSTKLIPSRVGSVLTTVTS